MRRMAWVLFLIFPTIVVLSGCGDSKPPSVNIGVTPTANKSTGSGMKAESDEAPQDLVDKYKKK